MRQWLRRHLFLTIGISSVLPFLVLIFSDLPAESTIHRVLVLLWQVLGIGPHVVANLLARLAPELPGLIDALLVILRGLLPCVAADALLARLRARRARRAVP